MRQTLATEGYQLISCTPDNLSARPDPNFRHGQRIVGPGNELPELLPRLAERGLGRRGERARERERER